MPLVRSTPGIEVSLPFSTQTKKHTLLVAKHEWRGKRGDDLWALTGVEIDNVPVGCELEWCWGTEDHERRIFTAHDKGAVLEFEVWSEAAYPVGSSAGTLTYWRPIDKIAFVSAQTTDAALMEKVVKDLLGPNPLRALGPVIEAVTSTQLAYEGPQSPDDHLGKDGSYWWRCGRPGGHKPVTIHVPAGVVATAVVYARGPWRGEEDGEVLVQPAKPSAAKRGRLDQEQSAVQSSPLRVRPVATHRYRGPVQVRVETPNPGDEVSLTFFESAQIPSPHKDRSDRAFDKLFTQLITAAFKDQQRSFQF